MEMPQSANSFPLVERDVHLCMMHPKVDATSRNVTGDVLAHRTDALPLICREHGFGAQVT